MGEAENTRIVFQKMILDILYEGSKMDSLIRYEQVKVLSDKNARHFSTGRMVEIWGRIGAIHSYF